MGSNKFSQKEFEDMRLQLEAYRDTVRKVERRSEEAERWRDLARKSTGDRPKDFSAAVTTELAIRKECDELAKKASFQRDKLCSCISQVRDKHSQELLESIYINGRTLQQLADHYCRSERTMKRQLNIAVVRLRNDSNFF